MICTQADPTFIFVAGGCCRVANMMRGRAVVVISTCICTVATGGGGDGDARSSQQHVMEHDSGSTPENLTLK